MQWGGPNPDNVYTRAAIDPAATYRVTGDVARSARRAVLARRRRHAPRPLRRVLGMQRWPTSTLRPTARSSSGSRPNATSRQLDRVAPRRAAVRSYGNISATGSTTAPRRFTIERVDMRGVAAGAPTASDISSALDRAATWVERSIDYLVHVRRAGARRRSPTTPFRRRRHRSGGAPTIAYGAGWWDLGPDEVLLITTEVPDADYWGWTVHHRYPPRLRRLRQPPDEPEHGAGVRRRRRARSGSSSRTTIPASATGSTPKADPKGCSSTARSARVRGRFPSAGRASRRRSREHLPAVAPGGRSGRAARAAGAAAGGACSPATSDSWCGRRKPRPQWVTELNAFGRQLGSPAALVVARRGLAARHRA